MVAPFAHIEEPFVTVADNMAVFPEVSLKLILEPSMLYMEAQLELVEVTRTKLEVAFILFVPDVDIKSMFIELLSANRIKLLLTKTSNIGVVFELEKINVFILDEFIYNLLNSILLSEELKFVTYKSPPIIVLPDIETSPSFPLSLLK